MELRENRDGRKLSVICRGAGIEWDKIEAIENLEIDEWMSIQVREDSIRYSCPDFDPLAFRFDSPITEFDFFMIIAQIARTKAILDHLGLDEHDILWDADYIYMSLNTRELKFMYVPTKRIDKENTVKTLINEIMYALKQIDVRDIYMTEFAFYLKREGAYSAQSLIRYVTEKENTIARLLRLNDTIQYEFPDVKKIEKEKEETLEIMDFSNDRDKPIIETMEESEDIVEVSSQPKSFKQKEIGIGDFEFLREDKEKSIILKVNDQVVEEAKESPAEFDLYRLNMDEDSEDYEDSQNSFATICRLSTDETMVIEENEFYLGKSKKINGFSIDGNQTISRRHAMITRRDGQYYIRDLESVNHTYVNGRKVKFHKEVLLYDGDIIQLANEDFEFHIINNE